MSECQSIIDSCKLALAVLRSDRRGVTAVEYAVIAGVLVAGIATAFTALSGKLSTVLGAINFGSGS